MNSEKFFRTVWKELDQEFLPVFDQCAEQTLWNTARDTELRQKNAHEHQDRGDLPTGV